MTAGELVHITLKMLWAHAVVGSVVAALKERPERFNPVGVGLALDVLSDAVTDRGVVEVQPEPVVTAVVVRVNGGPGLDTILDETF